MCGRLAFSAQGVNTPLMNARRQECDVLSISTCLQTRKKLTYHHANCTHVIQMAHAFDSCDDRESSNWALTVAEAQERALELAANRDASERKIAEDQLGCKRAERHMQRAELFRQQKLNMLEKGDTDDTASISAEGGRCLEVNSTRDICCKLLEQLCSLRGMVVRAMQTELLRRSQLVAFERKFDELESDLRRRERLSAYARGGYTADTFVDPSARGAKDINESLADQQNKLGTYQSVLKERREMWGLTVSHVHKLKMYIHRKEAELRGALLEVEATMIYLCKEAADQRAKAARSAKVKADLAFEAKSMMKRADQLAHEQTLLEAHSGVRFDSAIWQQGVMQRMSTIGFRQDLQVRLMYHSWGAFLVHCTILGNGVLEYLVGVLAHVPCQMDTFTHTDTRTLQFTGFTCHKSPYDSPTSRRSFCTPIAQSRRARSVSSSSIKISRAREQTVKNSR